MLTDLLACTLPVQQAPMGDVAGMTLAAAVAEAGGIGMISATGRSAEQIVQALRTLPEGSVGVNFVTDDLDYDVVSAASAAAPLVDFFWSDPSPRLVAQVHAGGALACWQVGSLQEACAAQAAGCDLIAVQGREAGGHIRGDSGLTDLLDSVVRTVDVPVLAAGGIVSATDVSQVLALGAAGVRLGTRLLTSPEAQAHPDYQLAIVEAGLQPTVITDAFSDCRLCRTSPRARVLRSCLPTSAASTPRSGRPPDRLVEGEVGAMALYAGAGAGRITSIRPTAEVLSDLFH